MRFRLATALLFVAAGVTTAGAAGLTGMGANIFGSYFNFEKANLTERPVSKIKVGKLSIELAKTQLSVLQKAFGGTIQQSESANWICYHSGDTNSWFISNALGGQEFVMMVAVETSTKAPAGCETSESFTLPEFGIPSLGAKSAEIKERFGMLAGSSKLAYRADRPGGYSDIAQYLGYVLKGGTVVGMGVGETSIPTEH